MLSGFLYYGKEQENSFLGLPYGFSHGIVLVNIQTDKQKGEYKR